MGFTDWLESLTPTLNIVRILAGAGLVTVFLAYFKRIRERRCWRNFKMSVHDWVDQSFQVGFGHPDELESEEWETVCERMLTDANFSPIEIHQLLAVSIVVAKGIAADRIYR